MVARGRGQEVGKMGEGDQKIEISNYKINNCVHEGVIHSMVTTVNNTVLYATNLLEEWISSTEVTM